MARHLPRFQIDQFNARDQDNIRRCVNPAEVMNSMNCLKDNMNLWGLQMFLTEDIVNKMVIGFIKEFIVAGESSGLIDTFPYNHLTERVSGDSENDIIAFVCKMIGERRTNNFSEEGGKKLFQDYFMHLGIYVKRRRWLFISIMGRQHNPYRTLHQVEEYDTGTRPV